MKKKVYIPSLLMSIAFSAVGMLTGILVEEFLQSIINHSLENVIMVLLGGYVLAATLFFGCLGLRFGLWLNRKRFQPMNFSMRHLLVAAALAFAVGAVGQLAYSLGFETRTRTVPASGQIKGAHVVVLMDESTSMEDMKDACDAAACAFIDSLDENTSVQFAAFSFDVQDYNISQFLPMTGANKAHMKDFILDAWDSGGTDFDEALLLAVDTLNQHADPVYKPVIIMLTDGVDEIYNQTVLQTLQDPDSNIAFFSVRITESDATDRQDPRVQALIDLADEDFTIEPAADGSVDIYDVETAFQNAMASVSTTVEKYRTLVFSSDFFLNYNEENIWRMLIRLLVCTAFSVLTAVAYYGDLDQKSIVVHGVVGLICGGLMAFINLGVGILAVWLLCLGAFTEIEEVQQHV